MWISLVTKHISVSPQASFSGTLPWLHTTCSDLSCNLLKWMIWYRRIVSLYFRVTRTTSLVLIGHKILSNTDQAAVNSLRNLSLKTVILIKFFCLSKFCFCLCYSNQLNVLKCSCHRNTSKLFFFSSWSPPVSSSFSKE
jgi:hypothetical protein